jgi:hypothetical protein
VEEEKESFKQKNCKAKTFKQNNCKTKTSPPAITVSDMGRWPESETITLTGPGPSLFVSHQYSVTASSLRALVSNYYEDTT